MYYDIIALNHIVEMISGGLYIIIQKYEHSVVIEKEQAKP
jgi:hypothetical protein